MKRVAFLAAALVLAAGSLLALHRELPEWYARAMPAWYARAVYPLEHDRLIREAARRNDLDPALVVAVIYAESGFREAAVSERGAIGLMQLLPATAEEIARRTGGERFEVADLRDPGVNIRYGSNYLKYLLERYDGSRIEALAAYHAGVQNVDRWVERVGDIVTLGDIPFPDTRAYVREVLVMAAVYARAYKFELEPRA